MKAELFNALRDLMLAAGDIRHVALWNQQVAFLEEEEPFELPAVFVEFAPIEWGKYDKSLKSGRNILRSDPRITLHLLKPSTWTDTQTLEFTDCFSDRFAGISVKDNDGNILVGNFMHAASATNHDHEEIVESLETFTYRGYKFY